MKFRNFIIVLLAVLMAFAFVSCKHEPKVDPKPTPKHVDYYQIEVTEGVDKDYYNRDKIKIEWEVPVKAGDTITLKYRSERAVYEWDIRDGSLKWVYEDEKNGFVDPVLGDDGWYTLTYTLGNDITGKAVPSNSRFGVYFRGNFVTTDIFEIKDIFLNDEELEIEASNIKSYAQLNDPAEDFDWSVKNYAVLFATGKPGKVDKTPIAEKVVAGGKVTGAPISKEGYTLTIFTDEAHSAVFDPDLPINEEKIFYYEYVGLPQTVTFVTGTEATIDPVKVPYGDTLTAAHTYDEKGNYAIDEEGSKIIVNLLPENPEKEGFAFAAWCSDEGATADFDLSTQIKSPITLYAKYGTPRTVTFDAQNGELEHATAVVADGYPVAMPAEAPTFGTKMFLGWFTDPECTTAYNFATPVVDADLTLYGGWVAATDVTLMEGSTTLKTFKAALDVALAADNENLVVVDDRIGYVFAGWYSDAELTTAYDYSTVVIAPFTLYAKWVEAPLYQLVSRIDTVKTGSIYSNDKFVIRYAADSLEITEETVLSFRYRTTATLDYMSVRGPVDWNKQNTSEGFGMKTHESKEDGWTYVEYQFPKDTDESWFRFDFGTWTARVGDVLEIQDWALNGEPLAIESANVVQKTGDMSVGESLNATYAVIAGGSYNWADVTISFEMGEHATAIEDDTIEFGECFEAPETVTVEDGYLFGGWFADAELENEFDFDSAITKNTTIYAKVGEKVSVTFNTDGGSPVEVQYVASGNAVDEPPAPEKANNVFGGWYTENTFENEYNFATPVTTNITLYAKWTPSWTVTLNMNNGATPDTKAVYVAQGEVMAQPKNPGRAGYFFAGWYNDQAGTEAHDWSAAVNGNATVFAKWTEATTVYQFTATREYERFQFRWHESTVPMFVAGYYEAGDVITFMIRLESSDITLHNVYLKTRSSEMTLKKVYLDEEDSSASGPDGNGWYSVTAVVPSGLTATNKGLYLQVFGNGNWKTGDIIQIKALAYNGVEIPIVTGDYTDDGAMRSSGAYEGCKPNTVIVP